MIGKIVIGFIAVLIVFLETEGFGFTEPIGTIYKKVGDTLEIICTMDITSKQADGMNSTSMSFWNMTSRIDDKYVSILNDTSIKLTKTQLPMQKDTLICKLDNKFGISSNTILVDYPPKPVKNFKCRSYNWENLKCTFSTQNTVNIPEYKLHFVVDRKPMQSSMFRNFFTNTDGPLDSLNSTNARLRSDKTLRKQSPKFRFSVNECEIKGSRGSYQTTIAFDSPNGPYRQNYEFYYFKLFARNEIGNFTENFEINHYNSVIPAAPTNFTTSNWTSDSAIVSWDIPYALSTFRRGFTFRVNYTSSYMNGKWKQMQDITGNRSHYEYHLNNLEYAYDWYDMRIAMKVETAEDEPEMWSLFSNHTFQTKPRPPDNPPTTDIGGFSINDHGHVFVYWRELPISRSNGPNLHYDIKLLNNQTLIANKVISTMAKYDNLDGKYDEPLNFSIYSINDNGSSKVASSLQIPNVEHRLLPPQNIKKFLQDQMYRLTWLPPRDKIAVNSYTVFWCNSTDEQSGQCTSSIDFQRVGGDVNNFTRPFNGTTLNFAVSANSARSSSGMVWSKCTALPNSDIGKLEKIWIKELQSTYMVFEWMLSCIDHAILRGFRLTYCPINDPKLQDCKSTPKSIEILGEVNGYNLTDLKPYTTYKTYIQMFSAHSIGPNSDNLVNTTMETAPTPPRNLQYRNLGNTTVDLTWDEPEQYNGVLAKYEIHYNYDKRIVEANRSKHLQYVLDGLDAYTDYQIVIWACTNGGNACSKPSNSIKIRTAIGTPGELRQAKTTESTTLNGYIKYQWNRPEKPAGPIDYYEVKLRLILGNEFKEFVVPLNGTRCTLTKKYCNSEINLFEISVRGVNVIQSPHARTKRDVAAKYIELENSQLGFDDDDTLLIKRHSNAEIAGGSPAQEIHISDVRKQAEKEDKGSANATDAKEREPFPRVDQVCEEQDESIVEKFRNQDPFARHLAGNWSTAFASHCDHSAVGIFNLLIVLSLIVTCAFVYAIYYSLKKIRKMKDIGVELPAGLENIKEEPMSKGFDCDISKSESLYASVIDPEQEQSLLRSRMDSSSSSVTESSNHCECNEAMVDSEFENHEEDATVPQYTNAGGNVSPTPLLPTKFDSRLPIKKDPLPSSQPAFNRFHNGYVQPSTLMQLPTTTTSNGYVSHDAIIGKPAPSGYTPWTALGSKQIPPITPISESPSCDIKGKTPIVASTDVNGISGYVTHKQLSDFGQMMQ